MKFFLFSDCHGNKDALEAAINKAGFDKDNPDHFLVGLGDYFDRFRQPQEVMDYLNSIERKILCLGNHEELLLDCINRGYAKSHDWNNGTAQTIIDLAPDAKTFEVACTVAYEKVKDFINGMVNYIELKKHICVHSWVPLISRDGLPAHYTRNRKFEFNPDWRNATDQEWKDARWGDPFDLAEKGLLPDKTVIFGHWHASAGRARYEGKEEFGAEANFNPYYGDGYIAIDGCIAAYNGQVNVVVLEDEFLDGRSDNIQA